MTEREAMDKVLKRRAIISHDLLKNGIFHHLGGAWRETNLRGTAEDVIYVALSDETSSSVLALAEAAKAWDDEFAHELCQFLDDITEKLGFVPTKLWQEVKAELLDDIRFVATNLRVAVPQPPDQARAISGGVWFRIDRITLFLEKLGPKLWDYFECFDAARVRA